MRTHVKKAANFNAIGAATNPIATRQAMEFFQSADGFVTNKDVALIRVPYKTGNLAFVKSEYINRDDVKLRSSGAPAEAEKATLGVGKVAYTTDSRALEYLLSADDASQIGYEYGMDVPAVVTKALGLKSAIHVEGLFSALLTSGNWYRTVTGAGSDSGTEGTTAMNRIKWSDATKDPSVAIRAEMRIFLLRTGKKPTNLRLGARLFEYLATHPLIRAQIALTVGGQSTLGTFTPMATEAQLSQLWGIKVSQSYGVKNTSDVDGTVTNAFIVSDGDALMTYDTEGNFQANVGPTGMATVAMTESCGFAQVAWEGVAQSGFSLRELPRPEIGSGGSQSWILDLYRGFVIVDNTFGTYFSGMY